MIVTLLNNFFFNHYSRQTKILYFENSFKSGFLKLCERRVYLNRLNKSWIFLTKNLTRSVNIKSYNKLLKDINIIRLFQNSLYSSVNCG